MAKDNVHDNFIPCCRGLSEVWINYITSITPSADFVPLVRQVNMDFMFWSGVQDSDAGGELLVWLKVCLHILCAVVLTQLSNREFTLFLKI
jgi:hypothetical protein